ncbi:MAG TPA: SDR family NAD(P)-dependent oxidoreductase [Acidisphaera sp.]|nr:SDR family NAD(P)-dependent oxidoreductase [Acidisphaera sp.]
MTIRFDDRVAIVTGAGGGLGRCHALGLAARGARVVVNDLGDGADAVVAEIVQAGGQAITDHADVTDFAAVSAMAERALRHWGRIDILVNNAGILLDRSFAKMDMAEFRRVVDVHLIGTANVTKAVWETMRAQAYGRIVLTSSSSGLYGNFGQANYGAAKAGMIGLMNVLHHEGSKYDIRVNTLTPTAYTRMTEGLLPGEAASLLTPESVTPAVLFLVSDDAPSKLILAAGAGCFAVVRIRETDGIVLRGDELRPETIAARFAELTDETGATAIDTAFEQTQRFVLRAASAR